MDIDIVTIFPDQVSNFLSGGIFKRAEGKVNVCVHDLRKFGTGKHKTVDDKPFGGGPGMVLKVEPIYGMVSSIRRKRTHIILPGPRGKALTSAMAKRLSREKHLIIICGHYEGVDERVKKHIADEEISIGNYILSGGELPALVISDAVIRHVPGVLGNPQSLVEESFEPGTAFEYPQYTRPYIFRGWGVPEVLRSGNHDRIERWRKSFCKSKP